MSYVPASVARRRGIILLTVIVFGILAVLLLFVVVQIAKANETGELSDQLSEARAVHTAIQEASRNEKGFGLPADIGATSAKEYLYRLVPRYISRERADSFLNNFLIGNVTHGDPYNTILFRSRPRNSLLESQFAVYWLSGGGTILPIERSAYPGKESSRTSQYLPD